jgi:hypothetical protein
MKRSTFKPAEHKAALKSGEKKLRTRKCSVAGCKLLAQTGTALKAWCSPEHGAIIAQQLLAKKKEREAKADRANDKKRRESLKTYSDWIADVQRVFNAFIRARDAGKPCICCGKPFEPQKLGGSMDAGHFRSRGSAPHLRFDERNVHGQRKNCNRPGGTTHAAFRAGMIARIGLEALEALEADQTLRHWTIDDLKAMKAHYKAKLKVLLKVAQ